MPDEFETKLFPPNLAMSPSFVIQRVTGAASKYGRDLVLTDRRFKKAREMRTTAAFLLGLSKITGKTYWVMPEHEAATPDTYGVSFSPHPDLKGNIRELLSVEVTEYESHSEGLVPFIKRKLSNKYLPEHYILLVQVNKVETLNTDEAFRQLQSENFHLGEIWMLGNLNTDEVSEDQFLVLCLYPTKAAEYFHWTEELEANKSQPDMLRASRGSGTDFTEGRKLLIKLPELD